MVRIGGVDSGVGEVQIFGEEFCEVSGWRADDVQMFIGGGVGEAQGGGVEQWPLHQASSF
jgi:hypothetical protein